MKTINYLLLFFMFIIMSCNKQENLELKDGNTIVKVKDMIGEYNGIDFNVKSLSSKQEKEIVVAEGVVNLDDNIVLIVELVEMGNIEHNTKATTNIINSNITNARVVTYYDESQKKPKADHLINETDRYFTVTQDGPSTLNFLAYGDNTIMPEFIYNETDKTFKFNPGEKKNVFFSTQRYTGNNIPASASIIFKPLYSKISNISVASQTSISNWPIVSVQNIKIESGSQNEFGDVLINKDNVWYVKQPSTSEYKQDIYLSTILANGNVDLEEEGYFIPSESNLSLSLDLNLKGKSSAKKVKLNLNKKIESGYNFKLNIKVRHNGIVVKYYTFGTDIISPIPYYTEFEEYRKVDYKYNDEIIKPKDPECPDVFKKFMKFSRWSISKNMNIHNLTNQVHFKDAYYIDPSTGNILPVKNPTKLNEQNFPSLKTSDTVKIYAFWEAELYRWDNSNTYYSLQDGPGRQNAAKGEIAKDIEFAKLPNGKDYCKYIGAGVFYDKGYTNLRIPCYWFKKWDTGEVTGNNRGSKYYDEKYDDRLITIENGVFPAPYRAEDYFPIPALGHSLNSQIGKYYDIWYSSYHSYPAFYGFFLMLYSSESYGTDYSIQSPNQWSAYGIKAFGDYIFAGGFPRSDYSGVGLPYNPPIQVDVACIRHWPDPTYVRESKVVEP